ncbi:MAG: YfbM family protein, partial [Myxococcaceae bacterium]
MSMIGEFAGASDEEITRLLAAPDGVIRFIDGDSQSGEDAPARRTSVDKAWHAIHYLLAGEPWSGEFPRSFIVTGGEEIGDVDLGYGPARAFRAEEVLAIHRMLQSVDGEQLMQGWDAEEMRSGEIYGVNPEDSAGEQEYVIPHYEELREF